jgi:hypothetical protein
MRQTTGELAPSHSVSALVPAVDCYVRQTYNETLKLPVPQQFLDLISTCATKLYNDA